MRAVIFEDEEGVRRVMARILERQGWIVRSYTHPGEFPCPALKGEICTATRSCCDVILTDKNMPGVHGIEFLRALAKSRCHCRNVAMISGYWTEEEMQEVRAMGYDIFHKPAVFPALYDWLNKAKPGPDST